MSIRTASRLLLQKKDVIRRGYEFVKPLPWDVLLIAEPQKLCFLQVFQVFFRRLSSSPRPELLALLPQCTDPTCPLPRPVPVLLPPSP